MKYVYILNLVLIVLISSCIKEEKHTASEKITIATGFTIPWAVEVIDEEEYLITDRLGQLYSYVSGEITALHDIPESVTLSPGGLTIGGLMDVSLHPQFDTNKLVYIAFVGTDYKMKIARFNFIDSQAENVEIIFESNAFSIGSRISWQDNEHFFLSQGVAGDPYPVLGAQDLNNHLGKIHRLRVDGSIPNDNPVFPGYGEPTSVWSYGHRDPQGLYYDPTNNILYSNEHGPQGGDELNIIKKGENYGWPLFSYGQNYDGSPVSTMTEAEAETISVLPIKHWTSEFNIAPSSLTYLTGSRFADYDNSFLIGSLAKQSIIRYNIETDETETLWEGIGRVRDIAQLPSGSLIILVDKGSPNSSDEGRIIKLLP